MNEANLQTTAAALQAPYSQGGLTFSRRFSTEGKSPYDDVQWERRTALISDSKGNTIFEQKDVEVPVDWSMTATNIVASKYLHGTIGSPERETGVRQLVSRVAETVRDWGIAGGYFASDNDAAIFHDELANMLLTQKVAFNSPVWFNVGCDRLEPFAAGQNWHWDPTTGGVVHAATGYKNPQCSACFINAVDDSMEGIMDLARTEALLFKYGSGTGTNFSSLRSSHEGVTGGGTASGPLSFMRGLDAFAGRHQERRQDASRGQDGDPECRASRHHRLHRVQGEGRAEGPHPDPQRLRRIGSGFRGLFVDLLPERQQLRARDRRVHARV